MTTALHQTAHQYRAQLAAREDKAAQSIEAAHAHALAHIHVALDALLREYEANLQSIRAEQEDDEAKVPLHWLVDQGRMARVIMAVQKQIGTFATTVHGIITNLLHDAAGMAKIAGLAMLKQVMTPDQHSAAQVPSASHRVTQALGNVGSLVSGFAQEAAHKVRGALLVGVSLGYTVAKLTSNVRQALAVSRWRARTIVRTSSFDLYRDATLDTLEANGAQQWVWTSQPGACPFCQSMDGTIHDISEEFVSHPNCRCVPVISN